MSRPASHKRMHPYLREWVIFAPATDTRPWNGAVVKTDEPVGPVHDPSCHLCPGTRRSTGIENPRYASTHVFDNDFASLTLDAQARGVCRVVCFHPHHNVTLAEMTPAEIEACCASSRNSTSNPARSSSAWPGTCRRARGCPRRRRWR